MSTLEPPPIEARGLRKNFRGRTCVDDVRFTVGPGRVAGLLGPNGAGKTTTIRMILGLAAPDSGDALIFGRRYHDLADPARTVGAVLDAGSLHPARTGRTHLRIAAARARVADSEVESVLDEVGMTDDADRRAREYSLGMRQRIALAAALLAKPAVLVLDEPANGLDPGGMHWLRQRLRTFAEAGGTVLLSSHLIADVQDIADDVVLIARGRVAAASSLDDALASSGGNLEDFYLHVTEQAEVRA
ncbi:ATP-binding cassette domain-containing protein [Saccharomonospora xinjiangensis]|uniref:ABC transporter ATP-binding protein n=1 Tax=Saccharomonospora xinjiangensis TaxID=75294 RepID=UPI00106F9E2B|nr:ATP-binding cassette domain-containing protein [Saccharomonospora xinjiangensis]QBQ61003.1 putative ABC transporter ATP-binding protein YbhF [Saccharomonospora xinjiangensis]